MQLEEYSKIMLRCHRSARKKNLLGSRGEAAEFAATQKDTELTANKTGSKV